MKHNCNEILYIRINTQRMTSLLHCFVKEEVEREGSSIVLESIANVSRLKVHPPLTCFSLFYFVFKFLLFYFQDNPSMSSDFWEEKYVQLEFDHLLLFLLFVLIFLL